MFRKLVPLVPEQHKSLQLSSHASYGFAADQAVVSLVGAEMHRAALSFPVAFIQHEAAAEDGGEAAVTYTPVAVLSFQPGRNLFVGPEGQWLGEYVPAILRGYPFHLLSAQDAPDRKVLCVEEDSSRLVAENGQPLFTEDEKLSELTAGIFDFLVQTDRNREATRRAVGELARLDLIIPWDLKINDGEQDRAVQGLFKVDESRLNTLPDEDFLTLRRTGALALAYAHLLSLGQTKVLGRLTQVQAQLAQASARKPQLSDMLDMGPDDDLSFNF